MEGGKEGRSERGREGERKEGWEERRKEERREEREEEFLDIELFGNNKVLEKFSRILVLDMVDNNDNRDVV